MSKFDDIKNKFFEKFCAEDVFKNSELISISNPFSINLFEDIIRIIKSNLLNLKIQVKNEKNLAAFAYLFEKYIEFLKGKLEIIVEDNLTDDIVLNASDIKIQINADYEKQLFIEKNNETSYSVKCGKSGFSILLYQLIRGLCYSFDETFGVEMVVYDLEATGLSKLDELTEIGAFKIKNGVLGEKFQTLINPERSIPITIQHLTHITNEMVKNAFLIKDAIIDFDKFIGNIRTLVLHNGGFDLSAIRARFNKYLNKTFDVKVYDTRALSQSVKPGSGLDLSSLSHEFNVKLENAHRAGADAEATGQIFSKLMFFRNPAFSYFIKKNIGLFSVLCFLENKKLNFDLDFRIFFRNILKNINKFVSKTGIKISNIIGVKNYLSLSDYFEKSDVDEIIRLIKTSEFKSKLNLNDSIKNIFELVEEEAEISLDSLDLKFVSEYIDMLPAGNKNFKLPFFKSGILTEVSEKNGFYFVKENKKSFKTYKLFDIKPNERIYYVPDYYKYGLFNLFTGISLIPLLKKTKHQTKINY